MARIDGLIDTSVFIDIWRANATAVQWLSSNESMVFGVPVVVSMELMEGAANKQEQIRVTKLLQPYSIVHITAPDSAWAQAQHAQYKLSHNVGIGDALIAAPAARLKIPIYTLNTKHFNPLPDVTAIRPY